MKKDLMNFQHLNEYRDIEPEPEPDPDDDDDGEEEPPKKKIN
jgi:hypothetical protein